MATSHTGMRIDPRDREISVGRYATTGCVAVNIGEFLFEAHPLQRERWLHLHSGLLAFTALADSTA